MGYKEIEPNVTFAEVSLLKSMEHKRGVKRLERINQLINWSQVEEILTAHYTVGSSSEGVDAYPLVIDHFDVNGVCHNGKGDQHASIISSTKARFVEKSGRKRYPNHFGKLKPRKLCITDYQM